MSRKPSKPHWLAKVRIGRTPTPSGPFYDLDSFTDASVQQWDALGRAVRDYFYALHFDLAGQRAARQKEIRSALRKVQPIAVTLDGWCRIVNYKYSLTPLSPAGSLLWVGQRFNIGQDVDQTNFTPFPALYIAENFETAFREYHVLQKEERVDGLTPEELALENSGSWVTLKLTGQVNNVFDLTRVANLKEVCKVLAKFNLSDRVRQLEAAAGRPPTALIRRPEELLKAVMADDWRAWPVQVDVPSNSQVLAGLLIDAGFEGILYSSAKGAGKCAAIFTRQLSHSDSRIALHADRPAEIDFAQLDATNSLAV